MRVYLTGATGFVGSNAAVVFAECHDAELFCPVRATPGGEHADRVTLARRAAAFGYDPDMVRTGRPPSLPQWPVPRDTRLDASATAAALDVELPDLDTQPAQLRREMEGATCRTT